MLYRRFGRTDLDISRLGFGAMRLPVTTAGGQRRIDDQEAVRVIRCAIDNGVNYIDTAFHYGGERSELVVARALRDGYRQKVKVATKNPCWLLQKPEDWDAFLDRQLERLETDHIDFYLQHGLASIIWDVRVWQRFQEFGLWERAMKAKQAGKIGHFGFSFHDSLPLFKEILGAHDWDFAMIQFNYLDRDLQAGIEGLRHAGSRGIPVVVMEPLKGGGLANQLPEEVLEEFSKFPVRRTPAEWAFRWVANFPEVAVVLSGMNAVEQVQENVRIFSDAAPGSLSAQEMELMDRVTRLLSSRIPVGCTGCYYCMPCPNDVDIPRCFETYNNSVLFPGSPVWNSQYYKRVIADSNQDASQCVGCGACETACPQRLPIIQKLKEAHASLMTAD